MATFFLKISPVAGGFFLLVLCFLAVFFVSLYIKKWRVRMKEKKRIKEPTGGNNGGFEFLPHVAVKEGDQVHPIR